MADEREQGEERKQEERRERAGKGTEEEREQDEERRDRTGKSTDEEREAFGPLDIRRHVKDDGRTLILYTLRERGNET